MRRGSLIGLLVLALAAPAAARDFDAVEQPVTEGASFVGTPVGDVDGDGVDDVLVGEVGWNQPEMRVVAGRAPADERPQHTLLRTRAHSYVSAAIGAGDMNADGRDDIAIQTWDTTFVIFGRGDGAELDLANLGTAGFVFAGSGAGAGDGGAPMLNNGIVAALDDVDGDRRSELAVVRDDFTVHVLHPPADPGGRVFHVRDPEVGTVKLPSGQWSRVRIAAGRDELLIARRRHVDRGDLFGTEIPAGGEVIEVEAGAETGTAWSLEVTGADAYDAWPLVVPDQDGNGRDEMALGGWYGSRVLLERPAAGAGGNFREWPAYDASVIGPPFAIGDWDLDGTTDIAAGMKLLYADRTLVAGGEWRGGSTMVPTTSGASFERVVGTAADVDGDGRREIVVAGWAEHRSVARVSTWYSRHLWARSQFSPDAWSGVDPYTGQERSPGDLLPLHPSERPQLPRADVRYGWDEPVRPVQTSRTALETQLSGTPDYVRGVARVKVRAARGSRIEAEGIASGWRGPAAWALPEAAAPADGEEPWLELPLSLPAPARATLERDGRLRVQLSTRSISRAGNVTRRTFSFVVVTRRPAPVVARRKVQRLRGGRLDEVLTGESGDDVLRGNGGADLLRGGTGNDTLLGGPGPDTFDGDDGDDRSFGGPGNDDLVEARFGDDELRGEDGDDVVYGGRGEDELWGGPGDDVLAGGSGPDVVDCGPGEDIVFVNFNGERKHLTGCEHVYEEPGVVHVSCADGGTDGPETVLGTEGDDVCRGLGGDDDLEGRGGDDRLDAGPGNDRLFGRFGTDTMLGGDGDDELEGGRGRDTLDGGPGNDRLNGGYDPDVVRGGLGDDRITARGGGADTIDCGPGADVAIVDSRDIVRGCERVDRSRSSAAVTSR